MENTLNLLQVAGKAVDTSNFTRLFTESGCVLKAAFLDRTGLTSTPPPKERYDLVLIHHDETEIRTADAVAAIHRYSIHSPCVVLVDAYTHDAIEFTKAGAFDCILRSNSTAIHDLIARLPLPEYSAPFHPATTATNNEGEEKFVHIFQFCPDAMAISRVSDGVYLDVNESFVRGLGYSREEVIGRSARTEDLGIWVNPCERARMVERLQRDGFVEGFEATFRTKHERIVTGLCSGRVVTINGEKCLLSLVHDISTRKSLEDARVTTLKLLHICNQPHNIRELAREVTLFLKQHTGCEAVGLRLREGSDFPYFQTEGFSDAFVEAEKLLCNYRKDGTPACDKNGQPIHVCMCGKILRGDTDPTKPYFTKHGSFWTNSTSSLCRELANKDRPANSRNRCIHEGYESLALIPLRGPRGTVGLLQLTDHAQNRFSPEKIDLLEALSDYITVTLEKLQSEQALRSEEEHLRQILDTAEAGYFLINTDGFFQKVNAAWLRIHGYTSEAEILGRHFSITLPEEGAVSCRRLFNKITSGSSVVSAELPHKKRDGTIGYHTISAHGVSAPRGIAGIEGFIIDTTNLHAVSEQYRVLFEQMLDAFIVYEIIRDESGKAIDSRFVSVNPAFEAVTGHKAEEVLGKRFRELRPDLGTDWFERFGEVERTGVPARFEGISFILNKHIELVAFRAREAHVGCVIRDMTERKQLELQLLHSQKMDAVGQLAGGVAHDFNNFLAAIMMHLNLLQRTPGMSAEIRHSLKELETEARRASSLTRQLLMFSYRQVIQLAPTDLNELLHNLIKMLRRLIGEHIKLTYSGSRPVWIDADPGMIDQVVMNLCVNARDAMPHGGVLSISVHHVFFSPNDTFGKGDRPSGDFVCLTVTDNGSGMSPETQQHIFEPFFTTKEAGKGTGLGLATVYSIVKQHRGWIDVKSQLGRGTVFRVFIPAGQPPAPNSEIPFADREIKGGAEGVLVVEDDHAFRNMVVMSLKVLGYTVFEAESGKSALRVWDKNCAAIGLLFTDQVMPDGMSGLDLCRQIRAINPSIRALITTGYTTDRIKPETLNAEGIAFLAKPFTAETLAKAVRQCLDETSPSPTPIHG